MEPEPQNVIRLRAGDRAIKGFDDETGASITAFIPSPKGRKAKARQKMMGMVDVKSMTRLQLSMVEARVFWQIVSHIPPRSGSVAYCSVSGLAEELGMHVSDVSKTRAVHHPHRPSWRAPRQHVAHLLRLLRRLERDRLHRG
jgi:hypothetical protein